MLALTKTKYDVVELMASFPVFRRWKDLGKGGHPVVAQCSSKIWVC